ALNVESDFLRYAVHGQVASYFQLARACLFDLFGLESHGRVLRDVKEVFTLEVLVAIGLLRVDRSRVDGDVHCGFGDVLVIPNDGAGYAVKLSANSRYHKMLDSKLR